MGYSITMDFHPIPCCPVRMKRFPVGDPYQVPPRDERRVSGIASPVNFLRLPSGCVRIDRLDHCDGGLAGRIARGTAAGICPGRVRWRISS